MISVVNHISNKIKILSLVGGIFFFLQGCKSSSEENSLASDIQDNELANFYEVKGQAQGTTYNIIYQDEQSRDLSAQLDSILFAYDLQNSIYKKESIISKINQSITDTINLKSISHNGEISWFTECFDIAKEVHYNTDGSFNPTVFPLVKAWGFLDEKHIKKGLSEDSIQKLLQFVDFSDSAIQLISDSLIVKSKDVKIDFNAIAQGHSVDVVVNYLQNLGVKNAMVEIGGELTCIGVNYHNKPWRIGIDKPVDNAKPGEEFQEVVELSNVSLATSGNYRKFYVKDGVKYAHTLNPQTGYPVQHSLLSATVITEKCANADAYATAFMVIGVEKSKEFLSNHPEIDVLLVYSSDSSEFEVWKSEGFDRYLIK